MAKRAIGLLDVFLLVTLIVFWGSSFVVVKIVLREGLTPIAIATFRFLIAGALFVVALFFQKNRNTNYRLGIEGRDVPVLVFLALTGVTFFFVAQYTGIELAGASVAVIFPCLVSPILITALSAQIFKEHLNNRQVLGIGMGALGTLIVIIGGTMSLQFNREFFFGCLILLSTPFLWSAYSLIGKKTIEKYDPFLVVAYITVLGGLFLIPFSLAENSLYRAFTIGVNSWLAIIFLSFTCSLLGYYIWFCALKKVGPSVTSSFLFAEPLVTALLAVTFVGEEITLFLVVGGVIILVGVYFITRNQN
jgi:drug/metabolite transporter (DMT)-like permease